jgi:hypothetical protein
VARKVSRFRDRRVALLASAFAELQPAEQRELGAAVELMQQIAARLPDLAETDA